MEVIPFILVLWNIYNETYIELLCIYLYDGWLWCRAANTRDITKNCTNQWRCYLHRRWYQWSYKGPIVSLLTEYIAHGSPTTILAKPVDPWLRSWQQSLVWIQTINTIQFTSIKHIYIRVFCILDKIIRAIRDVHAETHGHTRSDGCFAKSSSKIPPQLRSL